MNRAHPLPITALVLIVAAPLAWFACGGGSKPPETPAAESTAASSSGEPTGSDTANADASASSASAAETPSASPSSETTAAAAPPPPSFGSTDCGKCVDKTCAKQAAACGKNSDCQSALDAIHSCSQGAAACVDAATAPSDAKAKKLATAYETCAKKAAAGKACKPKCQ
jgi:hypothetical protein